MNSGLLLFRFEDIRKLLFNSSKKPKKLGKKQYDILWHFVKYPDTSAYEICPPSKNETIYKNTRIRIKELLKYNLIEISRKSKHKAEYCILTMHGVYYLLANNEALPDSIMKNLLKNYGTNILFDFLLYPYISRDTLLKIEDSAIFSRIFSYLHECCKKLEEAFYSINHTYNQNNGQMTDQLFIWNNIPKIGYDTKRLYEFLKLKFQWDWIDRAKIEKTEDDNAIRISYGGQSVLISLNSQRTKATLTTKGEKKYEFIVREGTDDDLIIDIGEFIVGNVFITMSVEENWISNFLIYNQVRVLDLIFSIISVYGRRLPALDALSQDNRFMEALEKTKEHFDKRYKFLQKR